MPHMPLVALVGRPNVENRPSLPLITAARAIVQDETGPRATATTATASGTVRESVVGTEGGSSSETRIISRRIRQKALAAMERPTSSSSSWMPSKGSPRRPRRGGNPAPRPEARSPRREQGRDEGAPLNSVEFYELGTGSRSRSPRSTAGCGRFLDDVVDKVRRARPRTKRTRGIRVALVGRPNVGKSSLLNKILREER